MECPLHAVSEKFFLRGRLNTADWLSLVSIYVDIAFCQYPGYAKYKKLRQHSRYNPGTKSILVVPLQLHLTGSGKHEKERNKASRSYPFLFSS